MKWVMFLGIFLLIVTVVHAESGSIKLVTAITEGDEVKVGNVPDMILDVRPGQGNIYIDSIPLTQIDTQISTRFANAVACDFLDVDCSQYDFFYTLRIGSSLVSGPSAGAAITVLTVAVLDDQDIRQDIVMTGTINSGGLIGPVGGIREKALAAQQAGLQMIVVPELSIRNESVWENVTQNITISIESIIELEDALLLFTGKNYYQNYPPLEVPSFYTGTMEKVAEKLCNRYELLEESLKSYEGKNNSNYLAGLDFYNKSLTAGGEQDFYAQASFCFSGSLRLRELEFSNMTQEKLLIGFHGINNRLNALEQKIDGKKLNTLTDLETYMIVKERISESRKILEDLNTSNISAPRLSYAFERLYSGVYWSDFFEVPGKVYSLENERLTQTCFEKIEEAQERIDYLSATFQQPTIRLRDDLEVARDHSRKEDYGLCIFKATKVKADADVLLTVLFMDESQVESLIEEKFLQAEKVMARQQQKDQFPILGYSYYEYADSLRDSDPYTTLIYLEYTMELSNLDMYFPPKKSVRLPPLDMGYVLVFLIGLGAGFVIAAMSIKNNERKTKQKKRKINPRRSPKGNLPGKKR